MINLVLAKMTVSVFGILLLAVYVFIFALIIICIIRVSSYFRNAGKEQKLMRMEMGKLAEEVHLFRQEIRGGKERDWSKQSE